MEASCELLSKIMYLCSSKQQILDDMFREVTRKKQVLSNEEVVELLKKH